MRAIFPDEKFLSDTGLPTDINVTPEVWDYGGY